MEFVTNSPHIKTENGDKIVYPFGPPIFQTHVHSDFTKELIEEGRKLNIQENDWNPRLAGNLKYGRSFHYKNDYLLKAEPYLLSKVEDFFNGMTNQYGEKLVNSLMTKHIDRHKTTTGKLILDTLWINFSQKHDYNPAHTHNGVLSFVIYCKVPPEIFKVQADSNAKKAGQILFHYGDSISKLMGSEWPVTPYENLMFIFPNELEHSVPPYWVDAERISVSGNFIVI
jgi:hypothetical protein